MTLFRTAATLALMSFATPLVAGDNPVVVELFTSQGCSSCPPADAMMHDLAKRDDVIGLALHVDYWDYIGWKDVFADPSHTDRQQGYAQSGGRSMIYTPQMIVNGQEDVVGARSRELTDLIDRHRAAPDLVTVETARSGADVTISLTPVDDAQAGDYVVQLVRYTPMQSVSIRRGELAGHDLDYANVVDSWTKIARWDGRSSTELNTSLIGDLPAVVLVQRTGHGPIVAAARIE